MIQHGAAAEEPVAGAWKPLCKMQSRMPRRRAAGSALSMRWCLWRRRIRPVQDFRTGRQSRPRPFPPGEGSIFRSDRFLPAHPNGMRFVAHYPDGEPYETFWYSIGGGAVVEGGCEAPRSNVTLPMNFSSGAELLAVAEEKGVTIADIVRANEAAWRDDTETDAFLDSLRAAMSACIERGMRGEGELPGGLKVKRRARDLHNKLLARGPRSDPSLVFDWVSLWALAVNEENAAGGRVVTAPTNGAAGVIDRRRPERPRPRPTSTRHP